MKMEGIKQQQTWKSIDKQELFFLGFSTCAVVNGVGVDRAISESRCKSVAFITRVVVVVVLFTVLPSCKYWLSGIGCKLGCVFYQPSSFSIMRIFVGKYKVALTTTAVASLSILPQRQTQRLSLFQSCHWALVCDGAIHLKNRILHRSIRWSAQPHTATSLELLHLSFS